MFYNLENHEYYDLVLSIIQLFFFGEDIKQAKSLQKEGIFLESILQDKKSICNIYENGAKIASFEQNLDSSEKDEITRSIKLSLYHAIRKIRNLTMPWGILTGIRPAKNINEFRSKGFSDSEIKSILQEKYLVLPEKVQLAIDVANVEEKIIQKNNSNKISVYLGIPFCPTRCVYCSFPSFGINKYLNQVDMYLDALEREVFFIKPYLQDFEIESIYIGGGTPTSLNEVQLERFLNLIKNNFKKPLEYTIEAGRADTITKGKLKLMKQFETTRISINPQTMNNKTLKKINRNHLEEEFIEAFYVAREEGFDNINTDIILGLFDEGLEEVTYTMEKLKKLDPESLTVHTLAIKRASTLKENLESFTPISFNLMKNLIDLTYEYSKAMKMHPYYMYRQKSMIGNFENLGYCKPDFECIYNIQIMEEKQTIISFGAGASSKFYYPDENRVERVFNVKDIGNYITRIDEMIERKVNLLKNYRR